MRTAGRRATAVSGPERRPPRRAASAGRLGLLVLAAALSSAATGCTASPMRAWQSSVEQYVQEHGNGDVNVLRTLGDDPDESPFGLLGAGRSGMPFVSPRRTDATGVLLGYRFVHSRGWYFFLVGLVEYRGRWVDWPLDDPRITDIRLVAFCGDQGRYRWRVSEPGGGAVEQYCRPQLERWRASHPDRAEHERAPTTFPTDADHFALESDGTAFTVTDRNSNASWTLPLWLPSEPNRYAGQAGDGITAADR